ncbi:hypothetical protein REMIM1_PE00295 (plasmid) [Rhizobium etli bv. mimosae str. Mim1]|nr:hypothetical protein REMIM1_PE00295 [Rhizobium etli bv. mimosae str. Mim1]
MNFRSVKERKTMKTPQSSSDTETAFILKQSDKGVSVAEIRSKVEQSDDLLQLEENAAPCHQR